MQLKRTRCFANICPERVAYFKFNLSFIVQFSIILSAFQRLSLSITGAADLGWKTNRGPVMFVFHDKCCRPHKFWKSLQGTEAVTLWRGVFLSSAAGPALQQVSKQTRAGRS